MTASSGAGATAPRGQARAAAPAQAGPCQAQHPRGPDPGRARPHRGVHRADSAQAHARPRGGVHTAPSADSARPAQRSGPPRPPRQDPDAGPGRPRRGPHDSRRH